MSRTVAAMAAQRIGICDGRILAFRHAGAEVDLCFIAEDNICRLIINVKPELKPIKVFAADCSSVKPCYCKYFCWWHVLFVRQ
jgi:hypothetical protein